MHPRTAGRACHLPRLCAQSVLARSQPLFRRAHGQGIPATLLAGSRGGGGMNGLRFAFFAHSWISDWNHGNAHFLRGLVQELMRMGHPVRCYEERGSWSVSSLMSNEGLLAQEAMRQFWSAFPQLDVRFYSVDEGLRSFLAEELRGTHIVVLHEWNRPELVNTVLSLKRTLGFRVL